MTVDQPTLATELKTTQQITITVQGANGFSGDVALAASAVDANNAPLTGWMVTLDSPTVTLAADGSATAHATLVIPSQNMGLEGKVKIDATSTAAAASATTDVTVANQVTYKLKVANGVCTYPTSYGKVNSPDPISVGTKVRWLNDGTANFEIHIGSGIPYGFTHQGQSPGGLADPTTEATTAYEQTATAASGSTLIQWYCHNPNEPNVALNSGYFKTL
ncbi:MAG: hypothetical protein HOV81_20580 [Kofleriaceae bacterium]|nr:hypothetical protein [Kofleriaceae bacterium]